MPKKNEQQFDRRDLLTKPFERTFAVREINEEDRTVELAFSSEEPYERWFGIEILDHASQSVRLDRLNGGAALLVNHDTRDQVGVVVKGSARIDDDKRGRAVVRFSRSERGEEIFTDVKDGIRELVSVMYRIHKYEVTEREGQADLVRVLDWEPYEISIVAIPADATVGVGRSVSDMQPNRENSAMPPEIETEIQQDPVPAQPQSQESARGVDHAAARNQVRTQEMQRINAIRQAADRFNVGEIGRQAIEEGWSVAQFKEKALEVVGQRNNKARAESEHNGEVDLEKKQRARFSLVRLMDAISKPEDRKARERAAFELEVCAEAARGFGTDFVARGEYIPESLLAGTRDLSAGSPTAGAELVGTNLLAGNYIEVLRNAMFTGQAGITVLPGLVGNVDIPRQTAGATSTWISAEDGDATESEPQFDQVSLSPRDLACYTEVTRRLLLQSTPSIEGLVRRDLAIAQALGIDKAVLYGSGSAGQPRGIANTSGINTKKLNSADPTYAELVEIVKKVMEDNALAGSLAWMIDPNGWEALSTTSKQASGVEGNFILNPGGKIAGYDWYSTNQVNSEEYFFGDWSQVLLGEWGGLEVNVDPYTHSLKGRIRFIIFKSCDIGIRQPGSFCYSHDGLP